MQKTDDTPNTEGGHVCSTDGLGRPPERADFEAWANVAGFGERDASGNFWFYRNGGDGMWEAYRAGAGDQRGRDAIAGRNQLNAILDGMRSGMA